MSVKLQSYACIMATLRRNGKFILFSQYWWPGDARSYGISNDGNVPFLLEYSNPSNRGFF